MNNADSSPLSNYNSLLDKNLSGYFANTRMRRHLVKSGLINKHGEITNESSYRLKMAKTEHRKNVRDLLANAIVEKALDMERMRQHEVRKRLDELYKIELVQKVRSDRNNNKSNDDLVAILSPRMKKKKNTRKAKSAAVTSNELVRTRLPDIHFDERSKKLYYENPSSSILSDDGLTAVKAYNHHQPVPPRHHKPPHAKYNQKPHPPAQKKRKKKSKPHRSLLLGKTNHLIAHRVQPQSMAEVTMKYHGSSLNLTNDLFPANKLSEVQVIQQHCGGSTICVFRELLPSNTMFTFVSRRHRGSPLGLTINLNGVCNIRVSSCCEYKHKEGNKIGGKNSQFSLVQVQGASPCYKCQIRLGMLDAKNGSLRQREQVSSDEEDAAESFDIIVSRAGKRKEKHHERPASAHVGTQTADEEDEDYDYQDDHFEQEENEKPLNARVTSSSDSSSSEEDENDEPKLAANTVDSDKNSNSSSSDSERQSDSEKEEEEEEESHNEEEKNDELDVKSDDHIESTEVEKSNTETEEETHENLNDEEEEKIVSDDDSEQVNVKHSDRDKSDHDSDSDSDASSVSSKSSRSSSESSKHSDSDSGKDDSDVGKETDSVGELSTRREAEKEEEEELADVSSDEHSLDVKEDETEDEVNKEIASIIRSEDVNEDEDDDGNKTLDGVPSCISRESTMLTGNEDGRCDSESKTIQFNEEVDVVHYENVDAEHSLGNTPRSDDDDSDSDLESINHISKHIVLASLDDDEDDDDVPLDENRDGPVSLDEMQSNEISLGDSKDLSSENINGERSSEETKSDDSAINADDDDVDKTIDNEVGSDDSSSSDEKYLDQGNDPDMITQQTLGGSGVGFHNDIDSDARIARPGSVKSFVEDWKDIDLHNTVLSMEQTDEFVSSLDEEINDVESLSLRNTIVDGGIETLKDAIKAAPNLKMLNLSSINLEADETMHLADIIHNGQHQIKTLLLHGNPLYDEGINILTKALLKNKTIQILDLGHCQFSDGGAEALFDYLSENTTLHELTISNNELTTEGWRYISSALKNNKNLKVLSIDANEIDDESCLILCQGIAENRSLVSLDIENNQLTDVSGAELYKAVLKCETLMDVTLRPNLFSSETEDKIRKVLKERSV